MLSPLASTQACVMARISECPSWAMRSLGRLVLIHHPPFTHFFAEQFVRRQAAYQAFDADPRDPLPTATYVFVLGDLLTTCYSSARTSCYFLRVTAPGECDYCVYFLDS